MAAGGRAPAVVCWFAAAAENHLPRRTDRPTEGGRRASEHARGEPLHRCRRFFLSFCLCLFSFAGVGYRADTTHDGETACGRRIFSGLRVSANRVSTPFFPFFFFFFAEEQGGGSFFFFLTESVVRVFDAARGGGGGGFSSRVLWSRSNVLCIFETRGVSFPCVR